MLLSCCKSLWIRCRSCEHFHTWSRCVVVTHQQNITPSNPSSYHTLPAQTHLLWRLDNVCFVLNIPHKHSYIDRTVGTQGSLLCPIAGELMRRTKRSWSRGFQRVSLIYFVPAIVIPPLLHLVCYYVTRVYGGGGISFYCFSTGRRMDSIISLEKSTYPLARVCVGPRADLVPVEKRKMPSARYRTSIFLLSSSDLTRFTDTADRNVSKYTKACVKFYEYFICSSRRIRLSALVLCLQNVKSDGIGNSLRLVFCRCWFRISAPTAGVLNEGFFPPWFSTVPPDKHRILHRLVHDRFLPNPLLFMTL